MSCVLIALLISSCSDVQNREKRPFSKKTGSTLSLRVTSRSTTTGTQTVNTLDSAIEKKVAKTLSQVLITGATKSDLFSQSAVTDAGSSFPNNKAAKKNTVTVAYSYMASDNTNDSVVVADISQSLTDKSGKKLTRAGKIFFDVSGVIIGYTLDDVPVTTTTPKAQS